jgi:carboxyl-terminal processing protease
MLTRNLQIICVAMVICLGCFYQARRLRLSGEIGTAMQLIGRAYVEPVDQRQLFDSAMSGMLADLDPYSSYIPPVEYQPFQDFLRQQFEGLGVSLEGPPSVERLTVVAPLAGSPAYKAGVEPGDIIMEIDGKSTEGMSVADASKLLRGPGGTSVRLQLQRKSSDLEKPSELITLDIRRAAVEVESVVGVKRQRDNSWEYFLPGEDAIAYIRVDIFGEKTSDEFKKALEIVKPKAKAIVIDLRENAGGLLPAAVDMCDMFLENGSIVTIQGRQPEDKVVYEATPGTLIAEDVPIAVLVNSGSASASEIVAAALRDRGRAVVAGERSYGKGTIQQVFVLDGGRSGLKLTTAKYFPPSGANIHRSPRSTDKDQWGVLPTEALQVKLNEEETRLLYRRWREAESPVSELDKNANSKVKNSEEKQASDETVKTANSISESLEDDPVLKKVAEYFRVQSKTKE